MLEFFHCGASDYRACLSLAEIKLAGFGRCCFAVCGRRHMAEQDKKVLFLC